MNFYYKFLVGLLCIFGTSIQTQPKIFGQSIAQAPESMCLSVVNFWRKHPDAVSRRREFEAKLENLGCDAYGITLPESPDERPPMGTAPKPFCLRLLEQYQTSYSSYDRQYAIASMERANCSYWGINP